jgi:predicted transposase YbfD/YdcC
VTVSCWRPARLSLLEHLARVPDPRKRRGVRHSLSWVLAAAVAAVLAGARSFTAIGEWIADAPPPVLTCLGIRRDPLTRRFEPPGEAAIRRILEAVDAAALDTEVGAWLSARIQAAAPRPRRAALAVDGKALRGTRHAAADGQAVHLLAVLDHQACAVLGQAGADGKTNEVTRFAPLLEPLDLAGCVVTADALHTQRGHAEFLVTGKNADDIFIVKKNQPGLYAQLKRLPGGRSRPGPASTTAATAATSTGPSKAVTVAAGLAFPHAAQAIAITRRTRPLNDRRWRTVTVYAITSLDAQKATPAQLAAWIRGHWQIQALHHIRDVTYDEDHPQVRTGNGPQVMAMLRNLAIAIIKLAATASIAAATRHHARNATRPLATLGLIPA